jgi:hypothetical protein
VVALVEPLRAVDGRVSYRADGLITDRPWPWKVSALAATYAPEWSARHHATIAEVRVEHVQCISEDDAQAEGVNFSSPYYRFGRDFGADTYRELYRRLWDELNAERGFAWAGDPWVWVYTFAPI